MFRSPLTRPATRRVLAAAVAACFGSATLAQTAGMNAIHGTASARQEGAHTTITTTNGVGTRHSAIDWRSFSVPANRSVFFAQPDAGSTSINRVTGSDPSNIFGTLGSNGRLVLVNPNGIAVGAGAVVDTAGFTASTLPMSAADAIAGRLRFGAGDTSANAAELSVQGEVLARNGDVVLLGPKIEAGAPAVVRSQGGDVILAAGRKVYLTGRGLEGIRFEVRAPDDRAVNLGRLQGDSVGIFASLLQHSGTIRAEGGREGGGRVVLQAVKQAEVAGAIRASAPLQGGSVHVSAERLVLKASAFIDVSHRSGGGEILLGGGWQGHDARIANAVAVDVEQGVVLKADATLAGNGGTVVVWSDDSTRFRGSLTALGAGPNGAGGRAEVSGRRQLIFRGKVDLGAASGRTGNLLLDPDVVTIRGGTGNGSDLLSTPNSADDVAAAGGLLAATGASSYTIYESELEGLNANISIQANRRIEATGSFGGNELLLAPNRNLKLELLGGGSGGILLQGMPIRTQGSGTVELRAAGHAQDIETDRITTAGGTITLLAADADVRVRGSMDSAGGTIGIAGNKVEFRAAQVFTGRVNVAAKDISNQDRIVLAAGATLATAGNDLDNQKDGVLEGSGHVDLGGGKLRNQGTLRPGGNGVVGDLRITGDLEQKKDATLEIDVAGPTRYDRLLVSGKARLDGDLDLTPQGYAPRATDRYALLASADVSGNFDRFGRSDRHDNGRDDRGSDASGFPGFRLVYQDTRVLFVGPLGSLSPPPVTVTPAPAPVQPGQPAQAEPQVAGNGSNSSAADSAPSAPSASPVSPPPEPVTAQAPEAVAQPKFVSTAVMGSGPVQELAPLLQQPAAVQAAVLQPAASTEAFLASAAQGMQPADTREAAAAKLRIRVTAVQCRAD